MTDSVAGDGPLRLFVAFTLPEHVLDAVAAWQRTALPRAAGRPVPRGNLHATIAFLGARPPGDVAAAAAAVRSACAGRRAPVLAGGGYRETRSVGMLVLDDDGGRGGELAEAVQAGLGAAGIYEPEGRPWLPHVTVVRFRRAPQLAPAPAGLPPFSPSGAAVFLSRLRSGGAQYETLEWISLKG